MDITSATDAVTQLVCPVCGHERASRRWPLLCVGGPSGAGKTTLWEIACSQTGSVVHLDADLIYGLNASFESPQDNYAALSRARLMFAWSLGQSGRPVVIWGAGTPQQFEARPERALFSSAHYLALVCDESTLLQRLRSRLESERYSDEFIRRTLDYNAFLKDPERNDGLVEVLDNTHRSAAETGDRLAEWIEASLGPQHH